MRHSAIREDGERARQSSKRTCFFVAALSWLVSSEKMQSLSYAQAVKGSSVSHSFESKTRRPNYLNFRHKQIMKRQEAITFLKQFQYFTLKLTGVAEMKIGTITCKTRKDVLELYDKLQKMDAVAFVKLYEQDNVNVVIGWVPIPMPNERIKSAFQNAFGPVIKFLQKKCRDGLVSGVRIIIMQKGVSEKNPIAYPAIL